MKLFYDRLRQLHSQSGQSQQSAVDLIKRKTGEDIHQTTFGSYVRGDREPPISAVAAIAKAFNISIEWLCGMTDDKRPLSAVLLRLSELTFPADVEDAARILAQMPEKQRRVHIAAIERDHEERKENAERWKRLVRSLQATSSSSDVDRILLEFAPAANSRIAVEHGPDTLFELA